MKLSINAEITIQNTCRPEINYTAKITRKFKKKSESFCETWKMTGGKKQPTEMEQLSAWGNSHAYYKAIKTVYGPQKSKKICQKFLKKDELDTKLAQQSPERLSRTILCLINLKYYYIQHNNWIPWET